MAIRLVPVPDCNPPFDDELPGGRILLSLVHPLLAGDADEPAPVAADWNDELAIEAYVTRWETRDELETTSHNGDEGPAGSRQETEPSPSAGAPPAKRPGPGGNAGDGRGSGDDRNSRADGDDLGQWPSQFAQILAETLAGGRPASQLTPWTTERARTQIRRLGPLLAVERRPRVQRVRASRPARDVVEVAVVAEFGSRTHALAARLERSKAQPASPGRPRRDARWLCTAIESA
jgi:hypothetical protein